MSIQKLGFFADTVDKNSKEIIIWMLPIIISFEFLMTVPAKIQLFGNYLGTAGYQYAGFIDFG